ncbi:MAG TPA: polysaccharide deacetylase family protein, partial [Clostridia bacterium]|nr:polysaccharide deacetylase family protein [Clostridia bacterium]
MPIVVITKKTLLIALAVIIVIIAAVVIAIAVKDAPAWASSTEIVVEEYEMEVLAGKKRELPVYSVQCAEKKIAITIDAAWEDDKTEFILDTLDEYNVKATFFLCGFWVEKYPDMVKEIFDRGHEIGNHSSTHPHMTKLSAAQMKKDVEECEAMIEKITGTRCTIFRAPYGEYNDSVILAMREAGYEVIQWDLDTVDWREERSAQTILDTVVPKLHPGCIVLCHNNGYKIKEYLPALLKAAQDQGYTFVTVSDLLLD